MEVTVKFWLEEKVSQKGNKYTVMVIVFPNGYKYESYVSNEQIFILNHMDVK